MLDNPIQFPEDQDIPLLLEGPCGPLEALASNPKQPATKPGIAVICHPNPIQGGSMTNKVVHTMARAYERRGFKSLRFNFRGVGKSAGQHDHGHGECDDLRAILQWVKVACPDVPIGLGGFSFGAYVAAQTAQSFSASHLITIAPPVSIYPDFKHIQALPYPWLVILGDKDELVPLKAVQDWVEAMHQRVSLNILPGADHFFHGRLIELRSTIEDALEHLW